MKKRKQMKRTKVETSENWNDSISDQIAVVYEVDVLKDGERSVFGRISKNGLIVGSCSGKSPVRSTSVSIDQDADLTNEERVLIGGKCVEGLLHIFDQKE